MFPEDVTAMETRARSSKVEEQNGTDAERQEIQDGERKVSETRVARGLEDECGGKSWCFLILDRDALKDERWVFWQAEGRVSEPP